MGSTGELGRFDVTMPLAKVWESEDGELWFEGVASSTSLDRQQERMTPNAIRKMAAQTGLDLLPSHSAGPLEELGTVEEAWADNDRFRVSGRLDRSNPRSQRLFEKVRAGRRYGLSVGGRVTKAFWRFDAEVGRQVRHIDDVELDHVAVCRPEAAANPDTYLATLAKAAEGVIEDGSGDEDEEAMLARIGRAAVEAARKLWPFAKSEEPAPEMEADGTAEGDEIAELQELRKEMEERLQQVESALEGLKQEPAEEAEADAEPPAGRSRAIPGQETRAGQEPWAGVL